MDIYAFILLLPFLLIRFTLLSFLDKEAIKRAAYFAPMQGKEVLAYYGYQIFTIAIFVYLCFLKVIIDFSLLFYIGIIFYMIGLLLCAISILYFGKSTNTGLKQEGIYRFSRNPMYIAYFVYFFGCALLTQSLLLSLFVLCFQISSHWIIKAEERWCIETFGGEYKQYMKKVRRYI